MARDPAADLGSGPEVTPSPGTGSPGAASAPADPGAAGQNGSSGQNADRSALNEAKEAQRIARQAADELKASRQTNQQLMEVISGLSKPQTPPTPRTPPHSQQDLSEMLSNGEYEKHTLALEANHQFAMDEQARGLREEFKGELNRHDTSTKLRAYLLKHFGMQDVSSEYREAIQREAAHLREISPDFDQTTAEIVAAGIVRGKALDGDLELPDFRDETNANAQPAGAPSQPTSRVQTAEIDWEMPNRGLPSEYVDEFRKYKLDRVLTPSENAAEEAAFRQVVNDVVAQRNRSKKTRAVFQ